jgi:hypothetical protein
MTIERMSLRQSAHVKRFMAHLKIHLSGMQPHCGIALQKKTLSLGLNHVQSQGLQPVSHLFLTEKVKSFIRMPFGLLFSLSIVLYSGTA